MLFFIIPWQVCPPLKVYIIMLLPIIAGGAGTYEMSIPVIMHVSNEILLAPLRP